MPEPTEPVVQTLHENSWLSLKMIRKPSAGISGYVYSHESSCRGRKVAILPYRASDGGREYLVRREVTPCWSLTAMRSAITGGWEGGDIPSDVIRELAEEAGYQITRDELVPLGESYASKSSDTVYSLFTADLTGVEQAVATGDGSRLEAEGTVEWLTAMDLAGVMDPHVHVMYVRSHVRTRALADLEKNPDIPVRAS